MIDRAPMRTPRLGIGVAPPAATVATQDIKSLRDVATLGSELVTNGGFTGGVAGWTLGANWAYGANNVVHTAGAVEALSQDISVVSGTVYVISFAQSAATAGSLTIAIGAVSVDWEYWQPVKSVTITAGATGSLSFSITPSTDYDGALDDISIKPITEYTLPVARMLNTNGSVGPEIRSGGAGLSNTAIGVNALRSNTTGYYNTAIGVSALYANTTGYSNTAIGYYALYANTTGNSNTAIGVSALYANTTGYSNTAIGYYALRSNTTGYSNTAIGYYALYANTTGNSNTAIGVSALYANTTGNSNTAIGVSALYANTTGYSNTAIGYYALRSNTTGYYNTAIGRDALYAVTEGVGNIALGYQAGNLITTGNYNIIIGYDIDPPLATTSNYVNIGGILKGTNVANGATAQLGFYGTEPINKPSVDLSGDTASDLANLITALTNLGLITTTP